MARKKSKRIKRKVVTQKEDKRFPCLECNREHMVSCTLDRAKEKGFAKCSLCGFIFECPINELAQSIDVYSQWADYKEQKEKEKEEDKKKEK